MTSSFGSGSANLDSGMYEEFKAISDHFCDGLFSIGKDGFRTRRMAIIWQLPGRHQAFEKKLLKLRDHSCTSDGESKGE